MDASREPCSVRALLPIVVEIGRDIGHEPFQLWRRAYACLIELLRQNLGIGSQLRLVETQEYVARAYMHSIANRNISHDTAGGMLDFLESDSTTSVPGTTTAPDSGTRHAQHPTMPTPMVSTRRPIFNSPSKARVSLLVSEVSGPSNPMAGARPTRNA